MTMRNTPHSPRGRRPRGFTLIELLVVIAILGILLALGTGGAMYMLKQSDRKKTITSQKVIIEAVHAFHSDTGAWPDITVPDDEATEQLLAILWENVVSRELLQDLPEGVIGDNSGGVKSFLDAFGEEMYYLPDGGLGGAPRLVSAGPDGKFGAGADTIPCTSDDSAELELNKDNILSDEGT